MDIAPALVGLFGTSGNNGWRQPLMNTFSMLGLDNNSIFNPITADWNEAAQLREDYQRQHCKWLIFHLGNSGTGSLSKYSLWELKHLVVLRPDTMLVIMDPTGLAPHDQKVLSKIRQEVLSAHPGIVIVESVAESIGWLSSKIGLEPALARKGLEHLVANVNRALDDAGLAPADVARCRYEQETLRVFNIIKGINASLANPWDYPYYFYGAEATDSVARRVVDHFRSIGWRGSCYERDRDYPQHVAFTLAQN
jgi:hypothetical protein